MLDANKDSKKFGKISFALIVYTFLFFCNDLPLFAQIKGDWPPFETLNGGTYPFESVSSEGFNIQSPVTIVSDQAVLRNVAPTFIKPASKGILEYRNFGTNHRLNLPHTPMLLELTRLPGLGPLVKME